MLQQVVFYQRSVSHHSGLSMQVSLYILGNDNIVELWRKHYQALFNCVHSNLYTVGNVDFSEDVVVRAEEVREAICKLDDNTSCGPDAIFVENLNMSALD